MSPWLETQEWIFLWNRDGWHSTDVPRLAADCRALGFGGVIIHEGWGVAHDPGATRARHDIEAAGLKAALGLGFPRPDHVTVTALADAVVNALGTGMPVLLDAEGAYDNGATGFVNSLVDSVLSRVPDAPSRTCDVGWWKPEVHPHWPLKEFGRLAGTRFPQTYGAPTEHASLAFLAHARAAYAKQGNWPVRSCVQAYHRTVADHCELFMYEGRGLSWNILEADAAFRTSRHAVMKMRALGCVDVKAYQTSAGLVADGIVGSRTLHSLGL